ncbi:hypothetical protein Dimus_017054 [Dionaea muscipula]
MAATSADRLQSIEILRNEWYNQGSGGGGERGSSRYMENRQQILRSYQFTRKQSLGEKIRSWLIKARRIIWLRFQSASRLRRVIWSRLHSAVSRRRWRLSRSLCRIQTSNCSSSSSSYYQYYFFDGSPYNRCNSSSSNCFWQKSY